MHQRVLYLPALSVDQARGAYPWRIQNRCPGCARLIADQSRMSSDLGKLKPGEQEIAKRQLLLASEASRDLITDRSRTIARLRGALQSLFPALELDIFIEILPQPGE